MKALAFVVFGDPERDDFSSLEPRVQGLAARGGRLKVVFASGVGSSAREPDFPGWARWADAEGLEAVLFLPLSRSVELPWTGVGAVEDVPVFFLPPPSTSDLHGLGTELRDFLGPEAPEAGVADLEFVVGTSADKTWLRVKGGAELVGRLSSLGDFLRPPTADGLGPSGPRHEVVELRNALIEKEASLRRLKREAQRYRRFFEDDLTGDFLAAPGGRVVDCNRAFARIFGFPSVDYALGFDLRRLFASRQDRRRVYALFAPRRGFEDQEIELVRPDGRVVSVLANLQGVLDDDGRLVQIRGFLVDNTPRKALEGQLREAQKMEGLGRLAGGIAHDFNNLLTVINGYAELLLSDLPADRAEGTELGEILQAGLKAADLTRQLLAFSRRQGVTPRVIDLGEVVGRMESMVRRLVTERIHLVLDLAPTPLPFLADKGQIEQVVLNLVLNARDAMPEGGTLTLTTRSVTLASSVYEAGEFLLPGTYVRLSVSDTGVGIEDSVRQRIFEPFFTTKAQGTGLGLAMVHGIVKQTGGSVQLASQPGSGSSFTLFFEQVGAPELVPIPTPAPVQRPQRAQGVVVVEDDLAVRVYVERILARQGYTVTAVADGAEALSLIATDPALWSVVVCDLVLPGMTGPQLVENLRQAGIDIPFLSMSGYTDEEIRRHGLPIPQGSFLRKPFQSRELIEAVRRLTDPSEE